MDYIILHRELNGEFKPVTFQDGVIVIYGDKGDAVADMKDSDVLFALKEAEPSKDMAMPEFSIGDKVWIILPNSQLRCVTVGEIKITGNYDSSIFYKFTGSSLDWYAESRIGKTKEALWLKICHNSE